MADTLLEAEPNTQQAGAPFIDRRSEAGAGGVVRERRQFTNSHDGLSDEAAELAREIDSYKAQHRRRFINYEEMLAIVKSLGYAR